jgi:hypothetical protein
MWLFFNLEKMTVFYWCSLILSTGYCLLSEWKGYLLKLYGLKQAGTWMSVISRQMSLSHLSRMCPPTQIGLVGARACSQGVRPPPLPQLKYGPNTPLIFTYCMFIVHTNGQRQWPAIHPRLQNRKINVYISFWLLTFLGRLLCNFFNGFEISIKFCAFYIPIKPIQFTYI